MLLRRSYWQLCLLLLFCLAFTPEKVHAAALAEDHTILYYLIELQRHKGVDCNGAATPPLPSLTPSKELRRIAENIATTESQQGATELLAANGLSGVTVFMGKVSGTTPQQAHDRLREEYCPSLMNGEYRYIGGVNRNGIWTLLMASRSPQSPQFSNGETAPSSAGEPGAAPAPSASDQPAGAVNVPPHAPEASFVGGESAPLAPSPLPEQGVPEYAQPRPGVTPLRESTEPHPVDLLPGNASPGGTSSDPAPALSSPSPQGEQEPSLRDMPGADKRTSITYPAQTTPHSPASSYTLPPAAPLSPAGVEAFGNTEHEEPLPDIGHKQQKQPAPASSRKGMRVQ